MKFTIKTSDGQMGSVLLVAVVSALLIGISMASYLNLVRSQHASVVRSQAWNSVIPVCEAGVEEALSHINDSAIGTNFALNGWILSGNEFVIDRTIGEGRYHTAISTNTFPIVVSTGYVKAPGSTNEISRIVKVSTTRWATGMKGMVTKGDINMNSQTEIDSFDSDDARYSTRGHYDPTKRKDGGFAGSVNGDVNGATIYGSVGTGPTGTATGTVGDFGWVGSNTGIEPGHSANDMNLAFPEVQAPFDGGAYAPSGATVTLTNLDFWSTMMTTSYYPTNPASAIITNNFGSMTVTNYPSGVLASLIQTNTTSSRTKTMPAAGTYLNLTQQGAWYYYDLITSYTYPVRTYTYSMTAANSSVTTEYYDYVLTADRYQMDSLSMSGSQRMLVLSNSTLYIKGDFSMTGNSKVLIAPNGRLKLYVGGQTSLAGNGVFNYALDASAFMYYGLPGNTSIKISGNAAFTGVIYAPRADMVLDGGGNTVYDIVGATVTKTATMKGHFEFHYDEKLGRSPVVSKYSVASWQEL